jgi:hypothetical protein
MTDWIAADAVLFQETQGCLAECVSGGHHEDVYAFAFFVDGANCNVLPCSDTNAHAREFEASSGKSGDLHRWSNMGDWLSGAGMFASLERMQQFVQGWRPIEDELKRAATADVASSRALVECSLRTALRLIFAGAFEPYQRLSGISVQSDHDSLLRTDIHARRQKLDAFRRRIGAQKPGKRTTAVERLGGRRWESGHWSLVDLAGTAAEDDDVRLLRDSQTVTAICLNDTQVTDAVVELILKGKWRANLRELWLRGTRVTQESIAQLRQAWPELQVVAS